jgi:F-type H+-transporting ATPase subunit b
LKRRIAWLTPLLLAGLLAFAQHAEPAKPPQNPPPQSPPQHNEPQHGQAQSSQAQPSPSQELVDTSHAASEGKEAAHGEGADPEAKFKYSPTVQKLAKLTGMSPQWAYWVFLFTNFIIVAGFTIWAWRKHVPLKFRARTASIKQQMEEARAASEAANRRLAEVEGRLARLDAEIAELRSQADSDSVAEEQQLRAQADADRQKIVAQAEQEIASAAKLARGTLKKYAAELAVTLAEQKVQVTPQADQALVHSFVEKLGTEAKS